MLILKFNELIRPNDLIQISVPPGTPSERIKNSQGQNRSSLTKINPESTNKVSAHQDYQRKQSIRQKNISDQISNKKNKKVFQERSQEENERKRCQKKTTIQRF